MATAPIPAATLTRLKTLLGAGGWLERPDDIEPFLVDHRKLYHGATPLVAAVAAAIGISTAPAVTLTIARELRAQGQVAERQAPLFTHVPCRPLGVSRPDYAVSAAREARASSRN